MDLQLPDMNGSPVLEQLAELPSTRRQLVLVPRATRCGGMRPPGLRPLTGRV